ncbi:hypothetical protein [Burkholderia mayonis]|uniref:hypothetical protein n=1 Tax=Burkholderia mayonis TaxID=1385591 RepID=UPI000A97B55A|nr:hypothetical protein [Burkholderia mayonis]
MKLHVSLGRLVILLVSLCLSGCLEFPVASTIASRDPDATIPLRQWYNTSVSDCGTPGRPAFLCSGVMIRGTDSGNPAFLPWDPSPGSITRGGISFSWLRTDNNYSGSGFHSGLIFYPVYFTPNGKSDSIGVLCVFPVNGVTASRPTEQGCGPSTTYPAQSVPCDRQGVLTADQWISHFNRGNGSQAYQCGWSTREGGQDTANHFFQNILSRDKLTQAQWAGHNELVLATWPAGSGKTLPIYAFYYLYGDTVGLNNARDDQRRYNSLYGQMIPVVRVQLPINKNGRVAFSYSDSDQTAAILWGEGFEEIPQGGLGRHVRTRYIDFTSENNFSLEGGVNYPPFITDHALLVRDGKLEFTIFPRHVEFGYRSLSSPIRLHTFYSDGSDACCITLRDAATGDRFSNTAPPGKLIKSFEIDGALYLDNFSMSN